MSIISFERVSKSYVEGAVVIDDLTLEIERGEFVVLLGASGCGKTTILKMINKLIPYDAGTIRVQDRSIQEWDTIELRRSIGYVIQQIGLLPHLTIEENIAFVLSLQGKRTDEQRERAETLIDLLGFDRALLTRYPRELSGGQRQRIGVARALAADPEIILMDEPFGAVDEIARTALQDEFKALHQRLGKTIIFVTHDIGEALKLGSRIVLIRDGRIEQQGSGEDLIFRPATPFVEDFFGLKGFKSMLDASVMRQLYERILAGELTLENLYDQWGSGAQCERRTI